MTEQQMNKLKSLLAESSLASELERSSKDLDAKILSAARERELSRENCLVWPYLGSPLNMLATVSLAVVLTVGLFLAMSQMIVPEERAIIGASDPDLVQGRLVANGEKVKDFIARPEPVVNQDAPSKVSRDRILMDFNLLDASDLLADMQFEFERDRANAQNAIDIAMLEISSMIELGTFDHARERYAMLLENCHPCSLPLTLEALVLSASHITTETG